MTWAADGLHVADLRLDDRAEGDIAAWLGQDEQACLWYTPRQSLPSSIFVGREMRVAVMLRWQAPLLDIVQRSVYHGSH